MLGTGIADAQVLKRVNPTAPAGAVKPGTSSTVVVDATVDPQGKVVDANVVRSNPLLDSVALAAARQWEFTPTVLNGKPVPVIVSIELILRTYGESSLTPSSPPRAASTVPGPAGEPRIDSDVQAAFQLLDKRQNEQALQAFRKANDQRGERCAVCFVGIARAYEMLWLRKTSSRTATARWRSSTTTRC